METVKTTNNVAEGGQAADGLLPASDEGRAETLMANFEELRIVAENTPISARLS